MHFLDLTLPTLTENLALDEALLLEAEEGGAEVLRLWEWPRLAVVLGAAGILAADVHEAACLAEGVPILRRASGGGTVLLGPGCLVYSLVLDYDRAPALAHIPSSYCWILQRLCQALAPLDVRPAGTSDLAWRVDAARGVGQIDRKISGNSQQRKRRHVLHHGTLLYDFDADRIGRYLTFPARRPEYRGERAHADFLVNLPIAREELKNRLCAVWQATEEVSSWPKERVNALIVEKYGRQEWVRRR